MNILFYEWNTIAQEDLEDTLKNMGHQVDIIHYDFKDYLKDTIFEEKMGEIFQQNKYDFVISFNFFPVLSNVCNRVGVKYIAWVWDSPLFHLFFQSVYNSCNYIFLFDKTLYEELKKLDVKRIYYMPLAVNVERLDKIVLSEEEKKKYDHDISFVGGLYDNNPYNKIKFLPDYLKGYFDGIMNAQMKIHGYNFISELLTENILQELYQYVLIDMDKDYIWDIKNIVEDRFINPKITEMERKNILNILSNHFETVLYTNGDIKELPKVHKKDYADYYTIMPKIFRGSKINLNITLRTIKTGIPLRVFDILGAGGFLITNYQSELTDYFEIDKDLVCYENEADLVDKIQYYLQHEEERMQIAYNGYKKVKNYHNYRVRLLEIVGIVFKS